VIRRVVEQVNRFTYLINKLYDPLEKLCTNTATFRTIIHFELDALSLLLLVRREVIPPFLERIDHKITGFGGATKDQVHLSAILINNSTGNILFTSPKIMLSGLVVSSGLTPTSEITNVDCSFAIQAQAFEAIPVCLPVVGLDVVEDGIRFWDFF